jgi:hypothetical protein
VLDIKGREGFTKMENPTFYNLYLRYLAGHGENVDIDINDLDSSDWDVTTAPTFYPILHRLKTDPKTKLGPTFVTIPSVKVQPKKSFNDAAGIGRYLLDFNGVLSVDDEGWTFEGDATGAAEKESGDLYDFDLKKNRGFWGETSTRIGREIGRPFGAQPYKMNIREYKPYKQKGFFPVSVANPYDVADPGEVWDKAEGSRLFNQRFYHNEPVKFQNPYEEDFDTKWKQSRQKKQKFGIKINYHGP